MRQSKIILTVCIMGFLFGCAGPTMRELRTDNAGVYTFERDIRYTEAYSLTREYAEVMYAKHNVGISGWGIHADLFSDEKRGEVGVEFHDMISAPSYYLNIQIASLAEDKTQVQVFYRWDMLKGNGTNLEKYIDDHRNKPSDK